MKLKGTIKLKQELIVFDSGFKKQILVLTVEDNNYEQHIPIEFLKDATDLLNEFEAGQECEVDINIRGSEYMDKFYASIQGWKIKATF